MELIEKIKSSGQELVYIIRAEMSPTETTFLTPPEFQQQVGFVVYPAGGQVARHLHRDVERQLNGTSEVLFIKSGRCAIDIYDHDETLVATRELGAGDLVVMVKGGHGFRMIEDTVIVEIKQGPYGGLDEKRRF